MREQNPAVNEAADYLDGIPKFSREKHPAKMLRQMLEMLGASPKEEKIIHVAGTNGKGSVCAFLSSVLSEAGHRTAVFTSPHLLSVKERFVFDGEMVDDGCFLQAFEKVKGSAEAFAAAGAGHPTYFEFLFLMFMIMLREKKAEYVILETGLGGRLDATNCMEHPALTIITSISLDHMEYLGNTVEQIAGEKAGIIKPGVPVIFDDTCPAASEVIEKKAREQKAPVFPVGGGSYEITAMEAGAMRLRTGKGFLRVPFAAEYQAVNAMLSFRAAERLGIPEKAIAAGIGRTLWPGRMEQIRENVYLDGAHNEGGIREFARAADAIIKQRREPAGRRILLFAVVSDKEYREMARILRRQFRPDILILTQVQYGRGLDIEELSRTAEEVWRSEEAENGDPIFSTDIRVKPTVSAAVSEAFLEKREEDTLFCAGSLYLIGEIKEVLKEEKINE